MTTTDGQEQAHAWNREHPSGTPVLAWPGTRDQEPLRTRTRGSAWTTDASTPIVRVAGHAGGIWLDHIEHDPTRQPAVPDIEFEPPPCPICGLGLDVDGDTFTCHACRASWNMQGVNGEWADPAAPRCKATAQAYPTVAPEVIEQCILAKDHDLRLRENRAEHRNIDGLTSWTDSDRRAVLDSAGEPV